MSSSCADGGCSKVEDWRLDMLLEGLELGDWRGKKEARRQKFLLVFWQKLDFVWWA